MTGKAGSRIYVVCSDEARNGKTLTARLYADHLLLSGRDVFVFDCDAPRGVIQRYYPDTSMVVDLERTQGQVRMFDAILTEPRRDYVIDLTQNGLETFFAVIDDLEFIPAAHDRGFELVILFVLDRQASSVMAARDLRGAYPAETFFLIRNTWAGNPLTTRVARDCYEEIEPDGEVVLPVCDAYAMSAAEQPGFSFAEFALDERSRLAPMVRLRLRAFLSDVFNQLRARQLAFDMDDLKDMGLI